MERKTRLVTLFNLPLAVACGLLLWRSLDWPLVGDAAIFHFIAGQMRMGAIPYRDIVDINMPLIYFVHAAIVEVGGMSDVAWRAFDLAFAALMAGLIVALVWPAGRPFAVHAALIVLATHLLLGPYAAGQRDYLMSIPALAAALVSARAAENPQRRRLDLLLAGACAVIAAAIKPSGLLLLALPALTMAGLRRREAAWLVAGAAGTGLVLLGVMAASGALAPFIAMLRDLMPLYAALDSRKLSDIVKDTAGWLAPTDGLALAAALAIAVPKPPRARALIGLTLFGLIHLLAQGKGWFYHGYPLAIGLACWGAWSLAALSILRAALCLALTAATLAWLVHPRSPRQGPTRRYALPRPCSSHCRAGCRAAQESRCSIPTTAPSLPWRVPGCGRPRHISNGSPFCLRRIRCGEISWPRSPPIRLRPSC